MNLLTKLVAARTGSGWRMVAAGLGDPSAVDEVAATLDVRELNQASRGRSGAPSEVRERVEALASGDRSRLLEVVGRWEPMSEGLTSAWWDAAWATALRHLRGAGLDLPARACGPETALEHELLTAARPLSLVSLRELSLRPIVPQSELRWAGTCPLAEERVTADDLATLRPTVLRALRGRAWILDDDALPLVRAMTSDGEDPYVAALGYEVCEERGVDVAAGVEAALARRARGDDPVALVPVAYCLNGWRVP